MKGGKGEQEEGGREGRKRKEEGRERGREGGRRGRKLYISFMINRNADEG